MAVHRLDMESQPTHRTELAFLAFEWDTAMKLERFVEWLKREKTNHQIGCEMRSV